MIEENENHVAETVALPIEDLTRDKPRMTALLEILGAQFQEVETALHGLGTERTLDNAVGSQLDIIGKIVGAPRGELLDEAYRNRLRVQILINRSNARLPEMLRILSLFEGWTDGQGAAWLRRVGMAHLQLTQYEPPVNALSEIVAILERIKGVGISLEYVYSPAPPEESFVFGWSGDAPEVDALRGLAWSGSATPGGKLAHSMVVE